MFQGKGSPQLRKACILNSQQSCTAKAVSQQIASSCQECKHTYIMSLCNWHAVHLQFGLQATTQTNEGTPAHASKDYKDPTQLAAKSAFVSHQQDASFELHCMH
eukprot:656086-Pelagomonas_calceolata.AAC.4